MTPAASASNNCLAATTAWCRVAGRSWSGCRSVRVPMLLARIEGSIGMGMCLGSGRRTGEPGQQARHEDGPGCRSGPTAPRNRVGSPPTPPENRRIGQATVRSGGRADSHAPPAASQTTWVDQPAAGKRQGWLLRSLTSLGGLVPARRRGWTEIPSACVSWWADLAATPSGCWYRSGVAVRLARAEAGWWLLGRVGRAGRWPR
jgi:hypothetical protein